ncbi:shikimate kinase [Alpinimonas psychrophila]|uniref:Shikimate kinase n=1 Tax=Alpinimonas psychrophila TaxID=748908 RepID=A0A7W3PNS1_9MICO|nr:shikimate kinase [Alpinimonas psychrophila]
MKQTLPRVVLIGAPASGKSKIAKMVAAELGCQRIDTDKVIVAEHGPIANIFDEHGEGAFRALERTAVIDALKHDAVLSLGGGAVIDADTQHDLSQAHCVLLTVSEEAVALRLVESPKRPLLRDGLAAWKALVLEREPIYRALADQTFDTSHRPLEDIASQICAWIRAGYPEESGTEGDNQQ